jgi:hypothetical protein
MDTLQRGATETIAFIEKIVILILEFLKGVL